MSAGDSVSVSNVAAVRYEPFIHDGQPFGQVHWLRTESGGDGVLYTGLWKHDVAVFPYIFPGDETFHLLEGRVQIELDGSGVVDLGPGAIVSFRKGQHSVWRIIEPMKKFFVISG